MSRDKAKGIFKAAETKWTEETMHEYTDVVYDDLEVAKDYIIDSGSNARGSWEKWKSGKLIQWGSSDLAGHNEGKDKSIYYPVPFQGVENIITQVTRRANAGYATVVVNINHSTNEYFKAFHNSSEVLAVQIYWHAIGTWK